MHNREITLSFVLTRDYKTSIFTGHASCNIEKKENKKEKSHFRKAIMEERRREKRRGGLG